jgi:hypothetical protein
VLRYPCDRLKGSSTVVAKKDVNLADGVRFNGQDPVHRSGKATGRGAFEVQRAQAISAAYYFDLAARDYKIIWLSSEEGLDYVAFGQRTRAKGSST